MRRSSAEVLGLKKDANFSKKSKAGFVSSFHAQKLAERPGFEPGVRLVNAQSLSRRCLLFIGYNLNSKIIAQLGKNEKDAGGLKARS